MDIVEAQAVVDQVVFALDDPDPESGSGEQRIEVRRQKSEVKSQKSDGKGKKLRG